MTNSIGDMVAANMAEIIDSESHRNIFKKASLVEKVAEKEECDEDKEDCSYAKDGKHSHKKKEEKDEDKEDKKKEAHNVGYLFEKQSFDQVMIGLMKLSQHLEDQGFTRTAGESLKLAEMLMVEAKVKAKKKVKKDMCKWCDCDPCECKSKKDKNKAKDKDKKKEEMKKKEDKKKK